MAVSGRNSARISKIGGISTSSVATGGCSQRAGAEVQFVAMTECGGMAEGVFLLRRVDLAWGKAGMAVGGGKWRRVVVEGGRSDFKGV